MLDHHVLRGPLVGVGAILTSGGKVLLMLRRNSLGGGTWSTPGGHLDPGENPADCAARELREEVGVHVEGFRFLAITNDVSEHSHYVTVWMILEQEDTAPLGALADEVAEAGWYPWQELPAPLFEPFARLLRGESLPRGALAGSLPRLEEG